MNWLTTRQQEAIRQLAAATPEREACGFVLANGSVVAVPNRAPDPTHQFEISPADYVSHEAHGICGVWHSHRELEGFSPLDQQVIAADPMPWAIYCLASGQFVECDPGAPAPLVGRPFVYGIYDCYSLVSDMLLELGASMPPWPRGRYGEWNQPGFLPFDQAAAQVGIPVPPGEQRRGDIVLLNLGDYSGHTDHIGVFMDHSRFLHHPAERLSRVDRFGSWWVRRLRLVVRPHALCS